MMIRNPAGLLVMAVAIAAMSTASAQLPPGATLLDADIVWDPTSLRGSEVSPDGQFIAYVSRGSLWVCSVTAGPPTKLVDLPNTITDFLAKPEYQEVRERFSDLTPHLNAQPIRELRESLVTFYGLAWTPSQDGIVYTLGHRVKGSPTHPTFQVIHVTLSSKVTTIASIELEVSTTPDSDITFHVTPDRHDVLVASYLVPLLWNARANAVRATCFDNLTPSSTSDRLLGVEIDSRQLALVDANFNVVKRFDVVFDWQRRCDLAWSPDERYVICKSLIEYPKKQWEGFRLDLHTGAQRKLSGGLATDRIYFSGRGGEFARVGLTGVPHGGYADGSSGMFIEIVPDDEGPIQEVSRFVVPPKRTDDYRDHRLYPPVLSSSDCTLFVMALPRAATQRRGFHLHLIDRSGRTWPFAPIEDTEFNTPFVPVAFANGNQTIVARKGSLLFSIPTASIMHPSEPSDE